MAVTWSFHSEVLYIEAIGEYTPDDLPRALAQAMGDPACPEKVSLLIDVTRSKVLAGRSPDEIRFAARFLANYAARIGRRCAVVASEDVHFGLARMGSVFAESIGVEAQVFRTFDAAMAWLKQADGHQAAGR